MKDFNRINYFAIFAVVSLVTNAAAAEPDRTTGVINNYVDGKKVDSKTVQNDGSDQAKIDKVIASNLAAQQGEDEKMHASITEATAYTNKQNLIDKAKVTEGLQYFAKLRPAYTAYMNARKQRITTISSDINALQINGAVKANFIKAFQASAAKNYTTADTIQHNMLELFTDAENLLNFAKDAKSKPVFQDGKLSYEDAAETEKYKNLRAVLVAKSKEIEAAEAQRRTDMKTKYGSGTAN